MSTPTRLKDVPGAGTINPRTGRTKSGGEYYFGRDGGAAAPQVNLAPQPTADPLAPKIADRKDALAHASFVAAQASNGTASRGKENRAEWWERSFGNAEWRENAGYPKMPDDFTPGGHSGESVVGHRRTSRRWYNGKDVAVRMPSVSAIKRFSRGVDGGTFDIPVQVLHGTENMQGWVRVTQHGPQWSVTGLGMNAADSARMSEAVRVILEHRTPTVALTTVDALRQEYRKRVASEGTRVEAVVGSTFIKGAAFDAKNGQITLSMGKYHYRYPGNADAYQELITARSPGHVFNAVIRGNARAEKLTSCDTCHRVFSVGVEHRCPARHNKAVEAPAGVWDRLARRAASVRPGRPRK
ncbi:KTSC domain-containing protein [Curtobacterium sp. MCBD17_040]|uniref:KTSC domain-containing protein n=1 Tax=Curtobacterium sp. MCBD17_040 TaxID=2175674 RepID=UPI0011B6311C|nr:KTSC domain-containing protein [Curtobacterium sp. MCBD17_040]WIB65622.1 KTSC domain-containing protein [Curtobacterium sp. MCBD17_040]